MNRRVNSLIHRHAPAFPAFLAALGSYASRPFRVCHSKRQIDEAARLQIEKNRLTRVPSFCAICSVGWGFFGVFYFLRGAIATATICAPMTIIMLGICALATRNPEQRKRYGRLHLTANVIGLTLDCLISGLATSSTVPFLCCIGIMAAHQSGAKVAVFWTAITVSIVAILHFALEPLQWPLLRERNLINSVVAFSGVILLVTWMAAQAEWLATKYFMLILNNSTELTHIAEHDQLTQLANRYRFRDELEAAKEEFVQTGNQFGLIMLDLDCFKELNDSLGHLSGDLVLKEVAARLTHVIGDSGTVARIGGDEFTVIVKRASEQQVHAIARRVAATFRKPIQVAGQQIPLGISQGAAMLPAHTECVEELQIFADLAVYAAKAAESSLAFYSPEMSKKFDRKRSLIEKLSFALEEDEFKLVYQPQVEIQTGRIIGVEALLRWTHVDKETGEVEFISPVEFVPILESTGQINQISRWVLEQACEQAYQWVGSGIECCVSVNVSPVQFRSASFVQDVLNVLVDSGIPPRLLDLEITEGVMVDRLEETREKLQRLKDAGVTISVDDFGTGYSSLAYLKHLAIDRLKIDRIFVKDIPDQDDGTIASSIVALAHSLDLDVLAEGVETIEQLNFLSQANCGSYQGYYFSKPVSADECSELLLDELQTAK